MKILDLPQEYLRCYEIISAGLSAKLADVTLRFEMSDEMTVGFDGECGYIRCNAKNRFARLLGIFAQKYKGDVFEVREKAAFETLGSMLDVSFGSALTVKSIFEYCEYTALCGFNQLQLYMEDMYEIKERPYFGYLRGRYSYEELKAIDDYAFDLGIEVIPCMQTLGHMKNYLCWPEAAEVKDGPSILPMNLLPDSEQTYEFIEQMIVNSSAPFRSRRIHIGCDETGGLGLGKYLQLHGYTDQFELFVRHVNRVISICLSHGLKPMMWGDMFIAYSSAKGSNYDRDAVISDKVINAFNKDAQIVFWHYGQYPGCEEYMLDKYGAICRDPIFAGGVRCWQGPLADNYFSVKAAESSLRICKSKGVKEVFVTVWAYVTTMYQTAYLELCHYGELAYNDSSEGLRERFEFLSGASYDAFMRMSDFNDLYDSEQAIANSSYNGSSKGNNYYISDILLNVLDKDMISRPRSGYYRSAADYFRGLDMDGEWGYLYRFALSIFDMLTLKSTVAEQLVPAYKNGDKAALARIRSEILPKYLEKLEDIGRWHSYHKDKYLRPFGTENRDFVLGGMKERAKTAIRRIGMYLDGELDSIDELEQQRLDYNYGPLVTIVPKLYY